MEPARVLIVDDETSILLLLKEALTQWGYQVTTAATATEALELIRTHGFDAALTDIRMPDMSGLELLKQIKAQDESIEVVVMTGYPTIASAVEALKEGAFDYLSKPLESLDAFEMSLTRALEHRSLLRENQRLFAEVQRLAVTDPLTGLYNRRKLDEVLDVEIERSRRYGR